MLGRADLKFRQEIVLHLHIQGIQGIRVADRHTLCISHRHPFEFSLIYAMTGRTVVPNIRKQALVDLAVSAERIVNRQIRMAARKTAACHSQIQIALYRERVVTVEGAAADNDVRPVFAGKSRHAAGFFARETAAADDQFTAACGAAVVSSAQAAARDAD